MAYKSDFIKEQMEDIDKPYYCASCPYCNGERDATIKYPERKPEPWTWWKEQLKSPKYTVAPMVDQSELPFRMLCRQYGATLAYTPMFHSRSFSESAEYRRLQFSTCEEDRPLFVQFCGHDAETVLAAAKHVENDCDAVDLNLGCPQGIARRGHYGSFLMEEWDTIHKIVHMLRVELACPVTVKMRRFDDMKLTLKYARMLRDAGAHVIAVHGRTRIQKGGFTGMADLDFIRAVKKEIPEVPIIANGNILQYSDIHPNLEQTGCDSAMSAEALLWDPRLFADPKHPVLEGRGFHMEKVARLDALDTAREYLDYVSKYPVDLGMVKAHLFKIMHHSIEVHKDFRLELGAFQCNSVLQDMNDAAEKRQQEDADAAETKKAAPAAEATQHVAAATTAVADGNDCADCPQSAVISSEPSGSPTAASSSTDGGKRRNRNHKDDEIFRTKLAMLYDMVARCRKAEEECDFEGKIDKKAAKAQFLAERQERLDAAVFDEDAFAQLGFM